MANELYEKESFEIGVKYTEICKNLSLAMFFLPMVPFVVVIGLFINIAAFFMAQVISLTPRIKKNSILCPKGQTPRTNFRPTWRST
jgi:hypothetical protein